MDTAFSKMAETWPHLLLLLSLFNPLLSLNLTNQNEMGNSNWVQPTALSPTPLMEDRQDDTFPTAATGATDKLVEATTETEPIATTDEDSSLSTGQDNTHVTENPQATSKLSTARSIPTEAETTEVTAEAETIEVTTEAETTEVTAEAETIEVTAEAETTEVTAEAETIEVTAEAEITEVTTEAQTTEVTAEAEITEVTTEAETTEAGITDEVPAQGSTFSTVMTTVPRVTTDVSELPAKNTVTMETRTETAHPVVTTKTPETSATSTQHPGPSASGSMSTTNASTGALVPEVNPGGRRPVTNRQPTTTIKPTTTSGDQAPADKGGFPCSTPPLRRDGLVSQCLIAIAALAGVATIFIVSTIVLCTKLSSSKHRYRMNRDYGTEMVCISNLLPDGNGSHGRPRNPKSNGALIPNLEDSEEDDLTLHSFLPETDRCS